MSVDKKDFSAEEPSSPGGSVDESGPLDLSDPEAAERRRRRKRMRVPSDNVPRPRASSEVSEPHVAAAEGNASSSAAAVSAPEPARADTDSDVSVDVDLDDAAEEAGDDAGEDVDLGEDGVAAAPSNGAGAAPAAVAPAPVPAPAPAPAEEAATASRPITDPPELEELSPSEIEEVPSGPHDTSGPQAAPPAATAPAAASAHAATASPTAAAAASPPGAAATSTPAAAAPPTTTSSPSAAPPAPPAAQAGAPAAAAATSTPPAAKRPAPTPPAPPPAAAAAKPKQAPPAAPSAAAAAAAAAVAEPKAKKRKTRAWFEEIFDDDYLRTLPFLTPQATQTEAAFLAEGLAVKPGQQLLDVGCGYGRHAMELAARGYHIVALDLSLPLLIRGADEAQRRGLNINFVHGDMRELTFDAQFDGAYCVFSTFGYFDDEMNKRVAQNVARALKPGARFIVEILNRDYIVADLPTRVWWEGDGCVVLEEVDFNFYTSRMVSNRSVVFEDGRQLEQEISIRSYSLHELGKLLHQAGFRVIEVSGSLASRGRFFGNMSRQIIVVAERRAPDTGRETSSPNLDVLRDPNAGKSGGAT